MDANKQVTEYVTEYHDFQHDLPTELGLHTTSFHLSHYDFLKPFARLERCMVHLKNLSTKLAKDADMQQKYVKLTSSMFQLVVEMTAAQDRKRENVERMVEQSEARIKSLDNQFRLVAASGALTGTDHDPEKISSSSTIPTTVATSTTGVPSTPGHNKGRAGNKGSGASSSAITSSSSEGHHHHQGSDTKKWKKKESIASARAAAAHLESHDSTFDADMTDVVPVPSVCIPVNVEGKSSTVGRGGSSTGTGSKRGGKSASAKGKGRAMALHLAASDKANVTETEEDDEVIVTKRGMSKPTSMPASSILGASGGESCSGGGPSSSIGTDRVLSATIGSSSGIGPRGGKGKGSAAGKKRAASSTNVDITSANALSSAKKSRGSSNTYYTEPNPNDLSDEPVYCLCRAVSFGEMICCDNKFCAGEWFHFGCVNLTGKPKGKWYCPECRGDKANVQKKV